MYPLPSSDQTRILSGERKSPDIQRSPTGALMEHSTEKSPAGKPTHYRILIFSNKPINCGGFVLRPASYIWQYLAQTTRTVRWLWAQQFSDSALRHRICLDSFSYIGSADLFSWPSRDQTLTVPVIVIANTTSSFLEDGLRTWIERTVRERNIKYFEWLNRFPV